MRIAVNSQHANDPRRDHRGYAEPFTSEQVDSLLSEDWLRKMVADIRGGDEKQKDRLPFLCPHYSEFKDNHRAQAAIMPEAFTFMTCVDLDDKSLVEQAIERTKALIADDMSEWQTLVLRMDYSARKKLHIWLRLPVGKTIAETQTEFCEEIGIPYDESCITPERFIYVTGIDEEIYRSENWLKEIPEKELEERREAYLMRGLDVDGRKLDVGNQGTAETRTHESSESVDAATERTRYIFRACMKEEDVTEGDLTAEGARHNSVKLILSHCNQLLTQEETLGVLKELMPNNWQDENIQTLVADFYTKYLDKSKPLSMVQKRIFKESKRRFSTTNREDENPDASLRTYQSSSCQDSLSRIFASKLPPQLPDTLPRLVKAVTCNTPSRYKATVAQAMFPPLGAYPKKLSFVYIDNQVRELRINCLIVAETGSGKDTCTKQPLTHIIADMKARDAVNRERLKKFNEQYNSAANSKQKPQRPDDLVIQNVKSDITKAALVQRTDEANGAPLYVRINELEQWDKIEGASGRNNQFTTLKLCDDEENDFGSDRASTQSVSGGDCLHLNWNANTTIPKVLRYFKHVMTDGPISRLCLATVPPGEIGADIAVFGNYNQAYDDGLKPFIENLKKATGVIDCHQARKMIRKLKDECDEFAQLSQDSVFDNLSHRALVIAFRKACLLYVANGMKWEKSIESFCRWSLFYDMYLKMSLFGDLIRKADDDVPTSKRGPRSLLEMLPEEFTIEDAKRIRIKDRKNPEKVRQMVSQWKSRGHILQLTVDSFKKVHKEEQNDK